MLRTLDRYLLRSFLHNYLLALFVMISLYVTLDLFVNFDEFTEVDEFTGRAPRAVEAVRNIASFYGYNLPLYFSQISAVITLFAAALTLARMQRANEMTAVLASGTSMYRIAAPVITAALLLNVLWYADQEFVLPRIAHKLVRERDDVNGRKVQQVWCLRDGPTRLLSAGEFRPNSGKMYQMMVLDRDAHLMLSGVLTADEAEYDAAAGGWRLERGVRIQRGSASTDVAGPDEEIVKEFPTFYKSDLTPEEIILRQSAQWLDFLSLRQLSELERRNVVPADRVAQIRHTRFTTPINSMVLLLLGIVFFLHREPTSVIVQGGKALAVCATCFIVSFIGQQLVGAIDIAPALPAWLPTILFAPVCAVLLDGIRT